MYKVYGTRICLYCDKAENLLKTKDLPFEKIYIDEDDNAKAVSYTHLTLPTRS